MKKYVAHYSMVPDDTGEWYEVAEVDARIAELEHQLDIRKAAIEAQFKLMARVQELEKALRAYIGFSREAANMIDADHEVKAFKLLIAMSGGVKNYRHDVDQAQSVL